MSFAVVLIAAVGATAGVWLVPGLDPLFKLLIATAGVTIAWADLCLWALFAWYRKAPADAALVRTGAGGTKVIIAGGAFVLPRFHTVTAVPLVTRRIAVSFKNADALLSRDGLPVDTEAEFYVRVEPKAPDVYQAFRSHQGQDERLRQKLIMAVRTAVASQDGRELATDRDQFVRRVRETAATELASEGMTIESMTVLTWPA